MNKYLQELSKIAESKGGKLISTEYNGAHSKYQFIDELGNHFETKGYSIKNGRWSPHTAQKRKSESLTKYKIEDLNKIAESKNGKCLSDKYLGWKVKHLWEDSKGRQFYKTMDEICSGQWSPHEKKEKLSTLKTKFKIEDLQEFALSKGAECLSTEYTRSDALYLWKDKNNKEFLRSWDYVRKMDNILYKNSDSKEQREILEFIESFGLEVEYNTKQILKSKELDIYIPSLKLAIEVNGTYFHSENMGKDRNYHLNKLKECEELGIKLIQIFDFEWNESKDNVKSFLQSKICNNSRRIYARNTEVRLVDKVETRDFLNKYHIQGSCGFTQSFGLYHNNELLCLITIGKHHRNNKDWVLSRYVGKSNVTVVGGLSKLCKAAKMEFGSFVTWVDKRISDGLSWIKIGWELEDVLSPDYFYYNLSNGNIVSKQSRKKSNVGTPGNMTELQHAELDGLTRVWDCGKLRLRY
jgi:very-short-patch-repair endonuclease